MSSVDQLFYSRNINDDQLVLDGQEAQHCAKVLRKQSGDSINVIDGMGNQFLCRILEISRHEVQCEILAKEHFPGTEQLILAVAPTKNRERMEWLAEKLVEIGVKSIVIMETHRTERGKLNMDRLEKKMISAMKQSMRFYLPELLEMPFEDVIQIPAEHKFIAHCMEDQSKINDLNTGDLTLVLIGPEGDFTLEEVDQSRENGFKTLDLGHFRLRTETAALVVASRFS